MRFLIISMEGKSLAMAKESFNNYTNKCSRDKRAKTTWLKSVVNMFIIKCTADG